MTHLERFWKYVEQTEEECWLWKGRVCQGKAYFQADNKRHIAARFIYQQLYGALPAGICVLHRCDNPICVRPSHLFQGTQAENIADRERKGRGWQSKVTHCPRGHQYTEENTRRYGPDRRYRGCRACAKYYTRDCRMRKLQAEAHT